jgi:hypothetical protein
MSCGCKGGTDNSKSPISTKVIKVNEAVELVNEPPYTMEEVTLMEEWLNSTTRTKEQTDFALHFNYKYFGEPVMGYCDIPCQHRIRRRVEHARQKLEQYARG